MVEATREAMGLAQIHDAHHAERIVAETRAALEPGAFERVWSAGRAVPLDEAVAEALTISDEVATSADG